MNNEILPTSPNKGFEDIKKVDENGVEYWEARELLPLLDTRIGIKPKNLS